jgi:hypothetical protein
VTIVAAGLFWAGNRHLRAPGRNPARGQGDGKRLAEIRAYLGQLDQPVRERHPLAGGVVAFYLPESDVAIIFDPRTFYRVERTSTHAILLEHEVPIRALGRRLPFETPEPASSTEDRMGGHRPSRGQDEQTSEYTRALSVLSASEDASERAIRRAYRARVKEVHPDHGGTIAEFRRVQEAYTTVQQFREA